MADGETSRKKLIPLEGRVGESGSGANSLLEIRMIPYNVRALPNAVRRRVLTRVSQ